MSRRRRRRSARRSRRSSAHSPVIDVITVLVLGLCGALLGSQVAGHFSMPIPIDRDLWHVVSPGLDARIQDPALGRGVYVEDGALTLRQHAFHRAEILTPKDTAAVSRVVLDIATGSLRVNFPGASGVTFAGDAPGGGVLRPTRLSYLSTTTKIRVHPGADPGA